MQAGGVGGEQAGREKRTWGWRLRRRLAGRNDDGGDGARRTTSRREGSSYSGRYWKRDQRKEKRVGNSGMVGGC